MTNRFLQLLSTVLLGCYVFSFQISAQNVSIKDVQNHTLKSKYDEKTVTISGIVTFPAGLLNQSVFYIQDVDFGIRCYNISPKLKVGDSIEVTGKIVEYIAETEILISDTTQYKNFGQRQLVLPKFQKLQDLHKNELAEGTLVRTVGRVENNSQSLFTISDGDAQIKLMLPSSFLEVLKTINVGDTISATGVMGRNDGYPSILNVRFTHELFKTGYQNYLTTKYAYADNNGDFLPDYSGTVQTLTGTVITGIELPSGGQLIHFYDSDRGSAIFNSTSGKMPVSGDSIVVTGIIGARSGFEQLIPNKIITVKQNVPVLKRKMKISQLLSEANQGLYVTVTGQVRAKFISKNDSFFELFDETGAIEVYIPAHLNNDENTFEFNENETVTISGIANQYDNSPPYNDHYQLKVISLNDIEKSNTVSSEVFRNILTAFIILVLIVAGTLIVIFLLRRQVKLKTQQIEKRAKYLDFENQLSKGLNRNLAVNDVLSFTANSLTTLFPFDCISFGIWDRKSHKLIFYIFVSDGHEFKLEKEFISENEDAFTKSIFDSTEPVILKPNHSQTTLPIDLKFSNWLCFPIRDASKSIGVVIISAENNLTTDSDIIETIKRISDDFAIGLRNAQLFDELQIAYHELKNAQSQLVQNEKMKAIGQLASGMAHDFNNILSIIMGLTQVMLKNDQSEENFKKLNSIMKAAGDGAEIISRIQEFSRINTNSEWESLDLNEILTDVISLSRSGWKNKKEVEGIKINILTRFSQIPYVLGNLSELRTVFTNILFNAMDAMMESGDINLTTWFENNLIHVSIEDSGTGMSEETKQKIFEPFFTTKGRKGNGLGMSQVYGIVQRHKGQISVDSKLGQGTKITVTLHPGSDIKSLTEPNNEIRTNPGKRILVIEDEIEIRNILEDILQTQGYIVESFETAEEALEIYSSTKYDLICSDLGLPGMSGWDFIKIIRKTDPKIPIMLVTGWGNEINQTKLDEFKVNGLISKPFKIEQIINRVYDLLENSL